MPASEVVTRPTDHGTDDGDLVARVRAGEERAFELLYQRYQPRIAAYVRGMVHDHGRAEDITQEVFISALRRMRETDREIVFKPWIYEIAKNACIDAFRRGRNASEVSFDAHDAIGDDEHGRLAEPGATPDSAVEGKVAIDNLCGAFGGLSAVHHDILVLREFEGLSYREIGDRLGMSRPAVESTLFRARKRLSEEYEELVSGERCLRVQRIVDAGGRGASGLRDQLRMARHLAHCQPCRRYARVAGLDLGQTARRPAAAAAARVAAFLPLPAFLRRRWGGDDVVPLLGHHAGGPVTQWSAQAACVVDPGLASSWAKAVATAATVAIAGVGAGAAFTDRIPLDRFGSGGVPLTQAAGPGHVGARSQALGAPSQRAATNGVGSAQIVRGERPAMVPGQSSSSGRAAVPAAPSTPAAPASPATSAPATAAPAQPAASAASASPTSTAAGSAQGPGRLPDLDLSAMTNMLPPSGGGAGASSGAGAGARGEKVKSALDDVFHPGHAASGSGFSAAAPSAPSLDGVTAPMKGALKAASKAMTAAAASTAEAAPGATAAVGDSVVSTVTDAITTTTSALTGFDG
jgi:RNA polymerase sigma factor (sigma-70 family)